MIGVAAYLEEHFANLPPRYSARLTAAFAGRIDDLASLEVQ